VENRAALIKHRFQLLLARFAIRESFREFDSLSNRRDGDPFPIVTTPSSHEES
jgi:hypothetical protein